MYTVIRKCKKCLIGRTYKQEVEEKKQFSSYKEAYNYGRKYAFVDKNFISLEIKDFKDKLLFQQLADGTTVNYVESNSNIKFKVGDIVKDLYIDQLCKILKLNKFTAVVEYLGDEEKELYKGIIDAIPIEDLGLITKPEPVKIAI